MVVVAMFSGGKDSVLAVYRASIMGYRPDILLFMITSLGLPNPHVLNIDSVGRVAAAMGLPLEIVRLPRHGAGEHLARVLGRLGATVLIAGDVMVEDHVEWYERVAARVGAELVEPIYGCKTTALFREIFELGMRIRVIGAVPGIHERVIGRSYGPENSRSLLKTLEDAGADPIGENGEYHTLVEWSPLHRAGPLSLKPRTLVDARPYLVMARVGPA